MGEELQHADYPHEPGWLYDCPACEAECFCTPDTSQCVHCAIEDYEFIIAAFGYQR